MKSRICIAVLASAILIACCNVPPTELVITPTYGDIRTQIPDLLLTPTPTIKSAGLIAFSSGSATKSGLYTINTDGTNLAKIVDGQVERLKWSGDGKQIVFSKEGKTYATNTDGTNLTKLFDNPMDSFEWSGDGRQIAFSKDGEIYVVKADGADILQLTKSPAEDNNPTWSPNAFQIAFISERSGYYNIYIINADGSGIEQLYNDPSKIIRTTRQPSWSPDGARIAFIASPDNGAEQGNVFVINIDGTNLTELTQGTPGYYHDLTWSPDGTRIAFTTAINNYQQSGNIFAANADGTSLTQLTRETTDAHTPFWSPDGKHIVFYSDSESYMMNSDGSNLVNMGGVRSTSKSWSPDGSGLAFIGYKQLGVMNTDGFKSIILDSLEYDPTEVAWQPTLSANLKATPTQISRSLITPTPFSNMVKRIAFYSRRNFHEGFYVVDANGYNTTLLTWDTVNDHVTTDPNYNPAVWSPDRSRLIYYATDYKDYFLDVMKSDGTKLGQLPYGYFPRFSPDGTRIAYVTNHDCFTSGDRLYCNEYLNVMNADGSNLTRLFDGSLIGPPDWSPDGTRIVFNASHPCFFRAGGNNYCDDYRIFVVNADGSNLIALDAAKEEISRDPVWSPNGEQILFGIFDSTAPSTALFCLRCSDQLRVYIMNADGSNLIKLVDVPADRPVWSPDGKHIAYMTNFWNDGDHFGDEGDIYVVNTDGTHPIKVGSGPSRSYVWSPDGEQIAFLANFRSNSNSNSDGGDVYLVNWDGSNLTKLIDGPVTEFSWSLDWTQIAFTKQKITGITQEKVIYVTNANGSNPIQLTYADEYATSPILIP
jgi:Tol biopolymer transport system component